MEDDNNEYCEDGEELARKEEGDEEHYSFLADLLDTKMVASKLTYFVGCSIATLRTFFFVFITSLGLSVTESGVINASRHISAVISIPIWGFVADKTGQRKLCYTIAVVGSGALFISMPFIGAALQDRPTGTLADKNVPHRREFTGKLFYTMLLLVFSTFAFIGPFTVFKESFVINVIKSRGRRVNYGYQKVFGSYGLGIISLLAGFCVGIFKSDYLSKFTPVFLIALLFFLLVLPLGLIVESQGNWKEDNLPSSSKRGQLRTLSLILLQNETVLLLISVFIIGTASNIQCTFLLQLMKDEIDASGFTMGFSNLVLTISEVIALLTVDRLMQYLGGPFRLLQVATFSYVGPFIAIAYVKNEWLAASIQIFNGIGFALAPTAAAEFVRLNIPICIHNSFLAIVTLLFFNLSGLLADLLGSVVYDNFGAGTLFISTGTICWIWFCVLLIYDQVLRKRLSLGYERVNQAESR